MKVPFSYLERQFADVDTYLADVRRLAQSGEFTLGREVAEFEELFAELCGMPHAVGVGTGTDAISISLRILGVGPGDEVITTPMTFIATVGAIVQVGATPVFVDSENGFVIDAHKIEGAITPRTRAILPVHYSGNVADMSTIGAIAKKHGLAIVEDACQAIGAKLNDEPVGTWGKTAAFSLHPLKNLNVWGDGGAIVTRDAALADKIRLYRNHGLLNRNEVDSFGINCRLDAIQAVIGKRLISSTDWITQRRREVAQRYDRAFARLEENVQVPVRRAGVAHVFHLYMIRVRRRGELLEWLNARGVEAKVHYPIPVHLQKAAASLGYGPGSFPVCEADCKQIISLPCHQHLTEEEVNHVIEQVEAFCVDGH